MRCARDRGRVPRDQAACREKRIGSLRPRVKDGNLVMVTSSLPGRARRSRDQSRAQHCNGLDTTVLLVDGDVAPGFPKRLRGTNSPAARAPHPRRPRSWRRPRPHQHSQPQHHSGGRIISARRSCSRASRWHPPARARYALSHGSSSSTRLLSGDHGARVLATHMGQS
jgi:hypothetical protein